LSDFHNALNILKKESTDNGSTRMSVINMVNNSHNQSFQFLNTTATAAASNDTDFNLSSATAALRPNTAPGQQGQGHHLRMIRALSHMSSYQSEDPAGGAGSSRLSPGLSRTLSGFKSSSNNFKKLKLSKSQSRTEIDLKERQKKLAIPHFGNRKIASCLIKLSQARLLISDEIPEHRDYHSAALHDAELAIQIIPSEINFSLVCVVCYIRLERYDQAAALLDTLLESHPSHKKVLYHRAFCYRAINNSLRAIECLTKVTSLPPSLCALSTFDSSTDHFRNN
jgi:tetratricopeptide (TPR) repeat protein